MGLGINDEVGHPTVFTKNRDQLLEGDIAQEFFALVPAQAKRKRLLSSEHFREALTAFRAGLQIRV